MHLRWPSLILFDLFICYSHSDSDFYIPLPYLLHRPRGLMHLAKEATVPQLHLHVRPYLHT